METEITIKIPRTRLDKKRLIFLPNKKGEWMDLKEIPEYIHSNWILPEDIMKKTFYLNGKPVYSGVHILDFIESILDLLSGDTNKFLYKITIIKYKDLKLEIEEVYD